MSARTQKVPRRTRTPEEDTNLWKRFRGGLGEPARSSAPQWLKLALANPVLDWTLFRPVTPPDLLRGRALIDNVWRIGLDRFELGVGERPWARAGATHHMRDRIHRFDWLPDLMTEGPAGQERGRALVDAWIDDFGKFEGFSWRIGPTADRVWNWLRCGAVLFEAGEEKARQQRTIVLRRQVNQIETVIGTTPDVEARFRALCVLAVMPVICGERHRLEPALDALDLECTAQILPDGGHVSRSPSRLLHTLLDLASVKATLEAARQPVPTFFDKWLPRMVAMLGFLRCEDGGLFPFNDGGEAWPELLQAAFAVIDGPPRRFAFAPKSGFQRLEREGLRLILDVGAAPPAPFGDFAHAGALGFELADDEHRLVTSCGYAREVDLDWQAAVRRTGAHSTLVLGGRDSAGFETNEDSRLLYPVGPHGISAKRLEEGTEIWLDAQHSGYKVAFGLLHRRRLFMSGDGRRLTGEDSLVRPVSRGPASDDRPVSFEIRFHLHPTASAIMGNDYIQILCEGGPRWRFKTSHPGTRIEKSIYLARGVVERTDQIVVTGQADPNGDGSAPPNCVRWAFLRDKAS